MAARAGAEIKKKTASQRQKEEEKREKAQQLNTHREALLSRLAAVDALREGFAMPALTGHEVEHAQYGHGTVTAQKEGVITVQYGETARKQKLPFIVAAGLLSLQDEQMEKDLVKMEELDRSRDTLLKEIHYTESLLEDLEKN